jgi:hypothetical protein
LRALLIKRAAVRASRQVRIIRNKAIDETDEVDGSGNGIWNWRRRKTAVPTSIATRGVNAHQLLTRSGVNRCFSSGAIFSPRSAAEMIAVRKRQQ